MIQDFGFGFILNEVLKLWYVGNIFSVGNKIDCLHQVRILLRDQSSYCWPFWSGTSLRKYFNCFKDDVVGVFICCCCCCCCGGGVEMFLLVKSFSRSVLRRRSWWGWWRCSRWRPPAPAVSNSDLKKRFSFKNPEANGSLEYFAGNNQSGKISLSTIH